ncbi:MAG: mevalonate kinase [Chloroflexota bacterium]
MTAARAPGKVILFGEHAVVYGRPAIAAPVQQVCAIAEITSLPDESAGVWIEAPDVGYAGWMVDASSEQPLARMVQLILEALQLAAPPLRIRVTSTIPIAAGMGSGAAVSVALGRALSQHLGRPLAGDQLSGLAFEVERIHHGTPSGIDNTVITFEKPVYFVKGRPPVMLRLSRPFHLVIADTGEPSPTRRAVEQVRRAWEADRTRVERVFDGITKVVERARGALETGDTALLGPLMNDNQALLEALDLSSDGLRRMQAAALAAGASGAKLSGAGLGGNLIALVQPDAALSVITALQRAGAVRTISTEVSA